MAGAWINEDANDCDDNVDDDDKIIRMTMVMMLELMHICTFKYFQCITIPSECPHGITNDTNEEVRISCFPL